MSAAGAAPPRGGRVEAAAAPATIPQPQLLRIWTLAAAKLKQRLHPAVAPKLGKDGKVAGKRRADAATPHQASSMKVLRDKVLYGAFDEYPVDPAKPSPPLYKAPEEDWAWMHRGMAYGAYYMWIPDLPGGAMTARPGTLLAIDLAIPNVIGMEPETLAWHVAKLVDAVYLFACDNGGLLPLDIRKFLSLSAAERIAAGTLPATTIEWLAAMQVYLEKSGNTVEQALRRAEPYLGSSSLDEVVGRVRKVCFSFTQALRSCKRGEWVNIESRAAIVTGFVDRLPPPLRDPVLHALGCYVIMMERGGKIARQLMVPDSVTMFAMADAALIAARQAVETTTHAHGPSAVLASSSLLDAVVLLEVHKPAECSNCGRLGHSLAACPAGAPMVERASSSSANLPDSDDADHAAGGKRKRVHKAAPRDPSPPRVAAASTSPPPIAADATEDIDELPAYSCTNCRRRGHRMVDCDQPCRFFNTEKGCKRGDACALEHICQ